MVPSERKSNAVSTRTRASSSKKGYTYTPIHTSTGHTDPFVPLVEYALPPSLLWPLSTVAFEAPSAGNVIDDDISNFELRLYAYVKVRTGKADEVRPMENFLVGQFAESLRTEQEISMGDTLRWNANGQTEQEMMNWSSSGAFSEESEEPTIPIYMSQYDDCTPRKMFSPGYLHF